MTPRPFFSVIIPAFNAAAFLERALDSVRGQSFTSFEVVITDDGSTDETRAVATRYRDAHPGLCMTVVEQQNAGIGAARNAALNIATGDFVAFLDADDTWRPDKLATVAARLKSHSQIDVVYHDMLEIWPSGRRRERRHSNIPEPVFENLLFGANLLQPSATTVRRERLIAVGAFWERGKATTAADDFHGTEDLDCWLRLTRAGAHLDHLPVILGEYHRDVRSLSLNVDYHADRSWNVFTHHYQSLLADSVGETAGRRRRYHRRRSQNAISRVAGHLRAGELRLASTYAPRAISAAPWWWKPYAAAAVLGSRVAARHARDTLPRALARGLGPVAWALRPRRPILRCLSYHDVPPEFLGNLGAQFRALHDHLEIVTPAEFCRRLDDPQRSTQPSVMITVDDGYESAMAIADALDAIGAKALFFVPTGFLDCQTQEEQRAYISQRLFSGRRTASSLRPGMRAMTWDDLRSLVARGHSVGAHTITHPEMIESSRLAEEVAGSGDVLEQRLGGRVEHFAIPFGQIRSVSAEVLSCARGRYRYVFTNVRGNNYRGSPLTVWRHAIAADAPAREVLFEAAGGYSFRHRRQRRELSAVAARALTCDAG